MKLFIPFFIFSLVFPYVGLWSVVGVGTQPIFIICILVFLVLNRIPVAIFIFLISIFFWFVEQLFSLAVHGAFKIVRLDLIIIMIASFSYTEVVKSIAPAIEGKILVKTSFFLICSSFFLMLFLFFSFPGIASDLNFTLSGHPQFFGNLGVSYYSPEPGLSAFGVVALYIVYDRVFAKSSISFELFVFLFVILLLISTLSLTGILLILISAYIFYVRINSKTHLLLFLVTCFIPIIIFGDVDFFVHPLERINALLNISDNLDSSPAIRINNMISLFSDFLSLYENRGEHGSHPVGFVSYFTILPFTTMVFLIFHLSRLQFFARLVFIFSCVMLPLTSPFIFSIYLFQRKIKENLQKSAL